MATKTGGAGTRKYGRNADKCARYRADKRREKSKIRRIFKASGATQALAYAKAHDMIGFYNRSFVV